MRGVVGNFKFNGDGIVSPKWGHKNKKLNKGLLYPYNKDSG